MYLVRSWETTEAWELLERLEMAIATRSSSEMQPGSI